MLSTAPGLLARENAARPVGSAPKLSVAHFAYLRALAEGVDRDVAARQYLGLEHGHQLKRLHEQAIDQLRAIARRAHDSRWRLIGTTITTPAIAAAAPSAAGQPPAAAPTLAQWVTTNGLEDWSEAEQLALYQDAFAQPAATAGNAAASGQRKLERAARLRRRQLAVLADLQKAAAVQPEATDPLDAWLDPVTADRLQRAGFVMLGEVHQAARAGGRWWKGMPGVGVTKAARIAAFVEHLLAGGASGTAPRTPGVGQGALLLTPGASPPGTAGVGVAPVAARQFPRLTATLDGSAGANRATRKPTIDAATDLEAIRVWVSTRARSDKTAAVYEREALRWTLWCTMERGKPMSSAGPDDCLAYMLFLQRIPPTWIHRGRRARLGQGWTPFRGQLGLAARRLAVKVLHLMCGWLVDHARYLDANPWGAVNRSLVDGADLPSAPTSRALSAEAYAVLLQQAHAEAMQGVHPAANRNLFILVWIRHTGLRASELLNARIGDLRKTRAGWVLTVVGKGNKQRDVSAPTPAMKALRAYLAWRQLPELEQCDARTTLVAAVQDRGPEAALSYASAQEAFKRFVLRAVRASKLVGEARAELSRTTQHWLRHTYATRFAEAGGAQDVLMAELGHANPSTTAGYYTAQLERRQLEVERLAKS